MVRPYVPLGGKTMDSYRYVFDRKNPECKTRSELIGTFGPPAGEGNFPVSGLPGESQYPDAITLPPIKGRAHFMSWRSQSDESECRMAVGDALADAWMLVPDAQDIT